MRMQVEQHALVEPHALALTLVEAYACRLPLALRGSPQRMPRPLMPDAITLGH